MPFPFSQGIDIIEIQRHIKVSLFSAGKPGGWRRFLFAKNNILRT
jgi:hypothetical protein